MNLFLFVTAITAAVALWVVLLRPWLRHKPWMKWFFSHPVIEWIEINIYRKSEMLAWSRYLTALGTVLTTIANIDPSTVAMFEPLFPDNLKWIPRAAPMVITLAGLIGEPLRRDISKPLEVVALPESAPLEVKEAVVRAEYATAIAVETVKEKV